MKSYSSFSLLLFGSLFLAIEASRVLLIGDSIDRYLVLAWCNLRKAQGYKVEEIKWGKDALQGARGKLSSYYCSDGNNSLAFVHTFGSKDKGPYMNSLPTTDPMIDTVVRVQYAFTEYSNTYGYPDTLYLHFASWDVQPINDGRKDLPRNNTEWQGYVLEFEANHHKRIQQALAFIGNNKTELALRTAGSADCTKTLLHEFNKSIRKLAHQYKLRLFDYDLDLWSIANNQRQYEKSLFFDFIHQNDYINTMMSLKIMGMKYSQAMIFYSTPSIHHLGSNSTSRYLNFFSERHYFHHFARLPSMILPSPAVNTNIVTTKLGKIVTNNSYLFTSQPIMLVGLLTITPHQRLTSLYSAFSLDSLSYEYFYSNTTFDWTMFSHVYLINQHNNSIHLVENHTINSIFSYMRLSPCDVYPISFPSLTRTRFNHYAIGPMIPYLSAPPFQPINEIIKKYPQIYQSTKDYLAAEELLYKDITIRGIVRK